MIILPTFSNPNYQYQIILDKTTFNLAFKWNDFDSFWVMSIYDVGMNPIVIGIRMVLNYSLIRRFHYDTMPKGDIWAIDTTSSKLDIGLNDFQNGVSLIYFTQSELAVF